MCYENNKYGGKMAENNKDSFVEKWRNDMNAEGQIIMANKTMKRHLTSLINQKMQI